MYDCTLDFPRGSTFGNMGDKTMTAAIAAATNLAGRVREVPDTIYGSGKPVKLLYVQNETGAAITVARKLCEFRRVSALDFGRVVGAFGNNLSGQGVVALPLDDAYVVGATIPEHDIFAVVLEGYCTVLTESIVGSVSLPQATAVAANAEGTINGARAAAGQFVIGTMAEPCYLHNTNVVIDVSGLQNASA